MEDDGRLIGVLEEDLLEDVEDDRDDEERTDGDTDLRREAKLRELVGQRPGEIMEETHFQRFVAAVAVVVVVRLLPSAMG